MDRREIQRRYDQSEKGKARRHRHRASPIGKAYDRLQKAASVEKVQARRLLNHAIEYGKIERQPCEICGTTPSEAHHAFGYDPSVALAVWWLCNPHHSGLHYALRGQ